MELIIKAKELRVEYTGREVLDIDELELYGYDRIGLVGENGVGKSTLLKVLLGELTPPGCKINRLGEFAYIPQLEEVALLEERDFTLMGKLGVNHLEIQTMSGGEETRLKIAQAFSAQVHGILADEPTSHLDREGIDFLIGQLKCFSGALLVISHDRYFLDKVVDKIWELKDCKITEYWGNYSDYLRQKEEEQKNQAARYEQFIVERDRLEQAAEEKRKQAQKIDQKAKGATKKNNSENGGRLGHQKTMGSKQKTLYNAAKSMDHRIAALGEVEAPENIRTIRFRQSNALELHNPFPICGTEINKSFVDKVLFEKASFNIPLGAKVALTGGNGSGKTTLIQMILNHEEGISISPKAEIGYFAQNGYKYNRNQEVMEFMQEDCDYNVSEIRSVLASMGFVQNDIRKRLSVLSGGEIIKLLLAKMLMGRYNILLMDEPSNFLDLTAINQLTTELNDENRYNLVVPPGAWEDWVNGGGWLVIKGYHVDLILRDKKRVEQIIKDTEQGIVTANYQTGHPHGYISAMYRGELAISRVQYAKDENFYELKKQAERYPTALQEGLAEFFMFESGFSLMFAENNINKDDVSYVCGHCFRSISSLNQVLFAVNREYCINEKKAVKMIEDFKIKPSNYKERVHKVISLISTDVDCTRKGIEILQRLVNEVEHLKGANIQ